jgi:AhpD family alkylhydroperoxidase
MFPIHTIETAPEPSQPLLTEMSAHLGRVPNLAAAMAESPELLRGFLAVRQIYLSGTFTPAEIQVLSLTAACENGCGWCMAFHTAAALGADVPPESVDALRAGAAPADARLGALSDFARRMVQSRGAVSPEELEAFLRAGYTRAQALEVVLGMAFSLMANYSGHLVDAPLDEPLRAHRWARTDAAESVSH